MSDRRVNKLLAAFEIALIALLAAALVAGRVHGLTAVADLLTYITLGAAGVFPLAILIGFLATRKRSL